MVKVDTVRLRGPGWRRLGATLLLSVAWGLVLLANVPPGRPPVLVQTLLIGTTAMLAFSLFERWPRRLPRWIARWALQVLAVAVIIPPAAALVYALATPSGAPPFHADEARMKGYSRLCMSGLLLLPWVALGALVRQKDALARHQALAFELERSELERAALDARLRLLQGQVAPHFLFNSLATVQALVDAGSPRASGVLRSLVAYLRAAVPRLDEPASTVGQEIELVRAYLELMQTRMPDRLAVRLDVDEAARALRCPQISVLTLVENAVRHGIDPSEEGGLIEITVRRSGGRCRVRVRDDGRGLGRADGRGEPTPGATSARGGEPGLGSGLATLEERLSLVFAGDASLRVVARQPRGVDAELDFPAWEPAS